jgi:DNA (cytosine-5)-methyltransferase 1
MKKNSHITVKDMFCGAGGNSLGFRRISKKMGGGIDVKVAMNHWPLAIETHNTNFPETIHDCADVSEQNPRRYPSTDILVASPECTNHSLAKGKKRKQRTDLFTSLDPSAERSRATMWDVPRFAEVHNYNIVIVENVVDARYWIMWDAWLKAMHSLGYLHKCVYYNSMHAHPTPQSRDRLYVVFWKKGNKAPNLELRPIAYCPRCVRDTETFQSWKKPSVNWGKYKQQYVYRCPSCNDVVEPYYYAAFNCIDWSIPGTRIGDRKKPLSPNSEKRVKFGIQKFWNEPQIIATRYTSGIDHRVKSALNSPLPTQPADASHAILNPIISVSGYPPILASREYDRQNEKVRDAIKDAMFTQTTHQNMALVMPFIVEGKGQSKARSTNDRLACITTKSYHSLVSSDSFNSFIAQYYNGSNVVSDIKDAARTFTTKERSALITQGEKPRYEDCYYRMIVPHEVQKGMAFDDDYIILGNGKEKTKQLGNAVTPPVIEDLGSRCIETLI